MRRALIGLAVFFEEALKCSKEVYRMVSADSAAPAF